MKRIVDAAIMEVIENTPEGQIPFFDTDFFIDGDDLAALLTELLTLRGYIRRPSKHQHPSEVNEHISWLTRSEPAEE